MTGLLLANLITEEVNGQVVPIDGSVAVRNAYAAWDSNPCSPDAANAVVSAIVVQFAHCPAVSVVSVGDVSVTP